MFKDGEFYLVGSVGDSWAVVRYHDDYPDFLFVEGGEMWRKEKAVKVIPLAEAIVTTDVYLESLKNAESILFLFKIIKKLRSALTEQYDDTEYCYVCHSHEHEEDCILRIMNERENEC